MQPHWQACVPSASVVAAFTFLGLAAGFLHSMRLLSAFFVGNSVGLTSGLFQRIRLLPASRPRRAASRSTSGMLLPGILSALILLVISPSREWSIVVVTLAGVYVAGQIVMRYWFG